MTANLDDYAKLVPAAGRAQARRSVANDLTPLVDAQASKVKLGCAAST